MDSYDAGNVGEMGNGYAVTPGDFLIDLALRTLFDYIQRALASPVDRMMVLTAVEGELVRQGRLPSAGFGGVFACLKRVWRKEGLSGFFRGLGADFVLSLPSGLVDAFSTNLVFMILQRTLPESMQHDMSYVQLLVVSMVATTGAVAVATPYNALRKTIMTNYCADIVAPIGAGGKTEKAEDKKKEDKKEEEEDPASPLAEGYRYATATETARSVQRRQGWGAFYRGAIIDPILITAYRGIYVATIALVGPELQMQYPSTVARGMALAADLITQPLEVISRRLMLTASDDNTAPYKGMIDCAKTIVREEGVTALWSGLKFRLIASAATVGLQIFFSALAGGGGGAAAAQPPMM